MGKNLGSKVLGINVVDNETAWWGLFVAHFIAEAGITRAPVAERASSWATWATALRTDDLAPGTVLVFQRPVGRHVGFYVGQNEDAHPGL